MKRPDPIEIEPDAWCAWCGDPLPEPEERRTGQLFCSKACGRAHWHDINEPPIGPTRGECEHCGVEFWKRRGTRFCGVTCYRKHRWQTTQDTRDRTKPPPSPRSCIECGQVFQPRRKDKLYCSKSCGNIHRNKRWRSKS